MARPVATMKQFAVLELHVDTTNEETALDSILDNMGYIYWMFDNAQWYNMQIMTLTTIESQLKFRAFDKYEFDQGMEGLKSYLARVTKYLYGKLPLGMEDCKIELRMYGLGIEVMTSRDDMREMASLIVKHNIQDQDVSVVMEDMKVRYPEKYKQLIQGSVALNG